jgi:hypothetical protein
MSPRVAGMRRAQTLRTVSQDFSARSRAMERTGTPSFGFISRFVMAMSVTKRRRQTTQKKMEMARMANEWSARDAAAAGAMKIAL